MMRRALQATLFSCVLIAFPFIAGPPAATALPTCPANYHYDGTDDDWVVGDNQVTGFRAEITLRRDSTLCDGGGVVGMVSDWVGIDNTAGTKITQIGFYHDRIDGVSHFYRFWAINGGSPNFYQTGDADGTTIFFKVSAVLEGESWVLVPYDCGGSDWSTCSAKTFNEPMYTSSYGLVKAETDIGGSECTAVMAGSANAAATFDVIMGQHDFNTSWQGRSLGQRSATCSHYDDHDYSNVDFFTWDDRN